MKPKRRDHRTECVWRVPFLQREGGEELRRKERWRRRKKHRSSHSRPTGDPLVRASKKTAANCDTCGELQSNGTRQRRRMRTVPSGTRVRRPAWRVVECGNRRPQVTLSGVCAARHDKASNGVSLIFRSVRRFFGARFRALRRVCSVLFCHGGSTAPFFGPDRYAKPTDARTLTPKSIVPRKKGPVLAHRRMHKRSHVL